MKTKIILGLIVTFIILGGISLVYAVEPHPECPNGLEWDPEREKCITTPKPSEPNDFGKEPDRFNSNVAVWFNANVTKNQAIDLIESLNISQYKLSEPGWDEESWLRNHGGYVAMVVPSGSEQGYIQKFKENNIVKTADLSILYEPGEQIEQQGRDNTTIIVIGIAAILIFVFFLIWYKLYKR